MSPELQALFVKLLEAILTFAAAVALIYLRQLKQKTLEYLEAKTSKTTCDRLEAEAITIVRYLEQSPVFQDLVNEKKKQLAIVQMAQFCEAHKIPLSEADIDRLIEAAVNQVKGMNYAVLTEGELMPATAVGEDQ